MRRARQLEGIRAAKACGVYKGRKPSINTAEGLRLRTEEKLGSAADARRLDISRARVYSLPGKQTEASWRRLGAHADQA
jgi:DNA invertase Pin-like site-specific DNA recombinase